MLSIPVTRPWPRPDYTTSHRHTSFVDPWLAVCDRCPLPDCVRAEGDLSSGATHKEYPACPVWVAQSRHGWSAGEALRNAAMLELREAVTWLEY